VGAAAEVAATANSTVALAVIGRMKMTAATSAGNLVTTLRTATSEQDLVQVVVVVEVVVVLSIEVEEVVVDSGAPLCLSLDRLTSTLAGNYRDSLKINSIILTIARLQPLTMASVLVPSRDIQHVTIRSHRHRDGIPTTGSWLRRSFAQALPSSTPPNLQTHSSTLGLHITSFILSQPL